MSTGCVILAAGASSRLGQPKQLVRWGDETLLGRAVRVAREAGCHPVVVILGADAEQIQAKSLLHGAEIVMNTYWSGGMGTSLRIGIEALDGRVGAGILMTCDQPAVNPAHLRQLILQSWEASCAIASSYAGRNGVPACFPAATFPKLMKLGGDQGARVLLANAPSIALLGGELDIDTPEALARARAHFDLS